MTEYRVRKLREEHGCIKYCKGKWCSHCIIKELSQPISRRLLEKDKKVVSPI